MFQQYPLYLNAKKKPPYPLQNWNSLKALDIYAKNVAADLTTHQYVP